MRKAQAREVQEQEDRPRVLRLRPQRQAQARQVNRTQQQPESRRLQQGHRWVQQPKVLAKRPEEWQRRSTQLGWPIPRYCLSSLSSSSYDGDSAKLVIGDLDFNGGQDTVASIKQDGGYAFSTSTLVDWR